MNPFENAEKIIESALFCAAEPLSVDKLSHLFEESSRPSLGDIRTWLANIKTFYADRGIELVEVASGYRFQAGEAFAPFIQRLEERKPPRYSRVFLETLALIAYRQPITRGEIEDVRGVVVNPNVIKTLMDREWIKIAGYRDVPGKPALFVTTKTFLDYFNLKSIAHLPPLSELVDFESLEKQLGLQLPQPISTASKKQDEESVSENEWIEMEEMTTVVAEEEVTV